MPSKIAESDGSKISLLLKPSSMCGRMSDLSVAAISVTYLTDSQFLKMQERLHNLEIETSWY